MNDESQARELAKARRNARVREFERKVVLRSVMSVRAGREWMFNLLGECGIYRTPYAPGDGLATAFNCGQQNVGLRLVASLVEACPDDYTRMMKEQSDDRHESADTNASDDGDDGDDGTSDHKPGGVNWVDPS